MGDASTTGDISDSLNTDTSGTTALNDECESMLVNVETAEG